MSISKDIKARMAVLKEQRAQAKFVKLPYNEDEDFRTQYETYYASLGKKVKWVDGSDTEQTTVINGHEITTKEPEVIETKDDIVVETKDDIVVETKDDIVFPEDLLCPHCGSKARTEASYLKNHGDNCYQKED